MTPTKWRRSFVSLVPLGFTGATAALLLLTPAAACSSSKAAPSDGGGPDVSVAEAADDATETVDASAGMEPESGPTGFVFFSTSQDGMASVGAVFDDVPVLEPHCRETTVYGACAVYTCSTGGDAGPTPAAGTLTFGAPALEGGVLVEANAAGLYALALPGSSFSPGDALTVTASGGAVPAFGPEGVPAPGAITLTDPAPDGGPISVATSSDFGFAWTGGGEDSLAVLTASGTTSDGDVVVARCSYVAITQEGILPSAVLVPLRGLSQGTLGWGQANAGTVDAGAWSVTVLAGAYGSTPATFE